MFSFIQKKMSLECFPNEKTLGLYVDKCNFLCPFCAKQNPKNTLNAKNTKLYSKEYIMGIIKDYKYNHVLLSGGEPTLYPEMSEFITELKSKGIKVALQTNGTNPNFLANNLVDFVYMDIKTDLANYHKLNKSISKETLSKIEKSIYIIKIKYKSSHAFVTTITTDMVNKDNLDDVIKLVRDCNIHYLQSYDNYSHKTLTPKSIESREKFMQEVYKIEVEQGINCQIRSRCIT